MNLASILLPNLNWDALAGVGIAIMGAAVLFISHYLKPFKKMQQFAAASGGILIVVGLGYWFLKSMLQDIASDPKITIVVGTILVLLGFGFLLFRKSKKRR